MRRLSTLFALLLASFVAMAATASFAQDQDNAIVIRGVVDARGPAAFRAMNDPLWTGSVHLVAWRIETRGDGTEALSVRTHPLRIELPELQETAIEQFRNMFTKRTLVRFSISSPIASGKMRDLALLGDVLPPKPDAELRAVADKLLNPPPFVDRQFGTFTPDRTFPTWLRQERQWLGQDVTVSLILDNSGPPEADSAARAVAAMRDFYQKREAWNARLVDAIANEYYAIWLKNWRNEGEPIKSRDEFKRHFELEGLSFYPEGGMSAMFSDGDLFSGHGMAVDYDAESDTLHVSMFG